MGEYNKVGIQQSMSKHEIPLFLMISTEKLRRGRESVPIVPQQAKGIVTFVDGGNELSFWAGIATANEGLEAIREKSQAKYSPTSRPKKTIRVFQQVYLILPTQTNSTFATACVASTLHT